MAKTNRTERESFWQRHQAGESYAAIAVGAGVSVECVRYWCRRQRKALVEVHPVRRHSDGLLGRFDGKVRYVLLRLRLTHPRWGPNRLRYHLGKRPSLQGLRLPSEPQIGRYLHQWPKFRRSHHRPHSAHPRLAAAIRVHQRWQVDFKMGRALQNGMLVNLHTVRDEVGAVCIAARVTAAGQVGHHPQRVRTEELQAPLRQGFERWHTLPEEVQTDHEPVFVGDTKATFPSHFTLWLVGLGIAHRQIRPGRPTDNAEVERCHLLLEQYVLAGNLHLDLAGLQRQLDLALNELAFSLASQAHGCHGQPPVVAHPQLLQARVPYLPGIELALFQLSRVDAFLAQFTWQRQVGKTGQICIGGHHHYYSVGRAFAQQTVLVRFDPQDRHFVFALPEAPTHEIARRLARDLSVAQITGLTQPGLLAAPVQLPLPFPLDGVIF